MNKILFFTGAGISAESGIPTFRSGDDGLWNNFKIDEVCNIHTFYQNKEKVFKFYNDRKKEYQHSKPNASHFFISQIQKKFGLDDVKIYTSNIDSLLEQAGCEDVIHVHGSMNDMSCAHCFNKWDIGSGEFIMNATCPFCGRYKYSKPGVIFFGETAPMYQQLINDFHPDPMGGNTDSIKIVMGSSLEVINEMHLLPQYGKSILVDPNPTKTHLFSHIISKKATESLDELQQLINSLV
jgi:NAD-dependent deacetylase